MRKLTLWNKLFNLIGLQLVSKGDYKETNQKLINYQTTIIMNKTTAQLLEGVTVFTLDGQAYLGKVAKTESGFDVSEAVKACSSVSYDTKRWVMAHNTNTLESFSVNSRNASLITRTPSESDVMALSIVVAQIDMAVKYAVPNLHNEAIDSI